MRKFKHKITGYIATETNSEKNYKVSEPKNFTIPKWIVEDSIDWEEIKEFPKIISYRAKYIGPDAPRHFKHIRESILECNRYAYFASDIKYKYENDPYYTDFEIYQVAVSETEIFTLGDKIKYYGEVCNITEIYFNEHNQLSFRTNVKSLTIPKTGIFDLDFKYNKLKKYQEPLFITEDNVEIFEGGTVWYIYKGNMSNPIYTTANPQILSSYNVVIFSTKEAAEDWLAKNKPKDLQYYEDLLLNNIKITKDYTLGEWDSHYTWLKNTEPKLYWLKVLEAIQQDLDDGWKPDWNHASVKWRIYISHGYYEVSSYITLNTGLTCFKSEESAQKAVQIMGDKLDIIFK